jgi:hypothetical protein
MLFLNFCALVNVSVLNILEYLFSLVMCLSCQFCFKVVRDRFRSNAEPIKLAKAIEVLFSLLYRLLIYFSIPCIAKYHPSIISWKMTS